MWGYSILKHRICAFVSRRIRKEFLTAKGVILDRPVRRLGRLSGRHGDGGGGWCLGKVARRPSMTFPKLANQVVTGLLLVSPQCSGR